MRSPRDLRRPGAALAPAWSGYLWEIAVLVLAAEKFPHHLVLAVAAVYLLRALAPFAMARAAANIDAWPLAQAWRGLLSGLGIASVVALVVQGPAWWLAVMALECGQALINPMSRKIIFTGLEPDARKHLVTWLGAAENLAMPIAYALMLVAGPMVGLIAMGVSYLGISLVIPASARVAVPASQGRKPSWSSLWATTHDNPVAWQLLWGVVPVAAVLSPLNPLAALLVSHRFHAPEAWVGILFAGLSVGTIGGYRRASHLPRQRSLPIIALGVVGIAVAPSMVVAASAFAVGGVGFGAFMSAQRQAVATQIDDSIRGQVQLVRQVGIATATIVGTLVALGTWAIQPDLSWIIVGIGGVGLAVTQGRIRRAKVRTLPAP